MAKRIGMSSMHKNGENHQQVRPKQIDLLTVYRTLFGAYVRNHPSNHPSETGQQIAETPISATIATEASLKPEDVGHLKR